MNRKAFEVTFKIGGSLAGSFVSAFSTAGNKIEKLKKQTRELKSALRDLDRAYKAGNLSAEQYQKSQEKITKMMERNVQRQERLAEAQRRATQIGTDLNNARQSIANKAMVTSAAATAATMGIAYNSVNKAMDFEAQLSSIQAVTGITEEQLKKVRQVSLEQGAATKYSALEAAQGFEELLKAGVSLETALGDGLSSALNLATAGGLELAEAAEILSDGLNGFKKDGMTAADVANILAGAANASSTSVREMKYGLSAVGSVADGMGVSFKEVNATLALFSNNALKGSDAGTSLKTFLAAIQPSTKEATELFRKYGLLLKDGQNIFYDTNGELKDMAEVAEILKTHFKDLTAEQRSYAFRQMFGSDAQRAANILYKEGAEGIERMYSEMSKVTSLDVAKQKMNNAKGAVEQLRGAFETLQIIGAEALNPLIEIGALNLAESFERNAPAVERFGKRLAANLGEVFDPFFVVKPEFEGKPEIKGGVNSPALLDQYIKDMEQWSKWEKFGNMSFDDKIIYSLDRMAEKIEEWVSGEGGQAFERIFTKLAEISMKAYANVLTTTVSGAVSNLAQGNLSAAGGLGTIAWLMGGGLLTKTAWNTGKGAISLGKNAKDYMKNKKDKKALEILTQDSNSTSAVTTYTKEQPKFKTPTSEKFTSFAGYKNKKELADNTKKVASTAAKSTIKDKALTAFSKLKTGATKKMTGLKSSASKVEIPKMNGAMKATRKIAGKAALPLMLGIEALNISKAEDKTKATGKAAGSISGGLMGASAGAAIGSVIPGIGTAIGGIIGGIMGSVGGEWLGGKTVDGVRNLTNKEPTTTQQPSAKTQATNDSKKVNTEVDTTTFQTALQNATKNFELLTQYIGRVTGEFIGSATSLVNNLTLSDKNTSLLAMYVGQASGWISSMFSIQTNALEVNEALKRLADKINAFEVNSGSVSVGNAKYQAYASGGIINRPHLGLVGEAGPEAIIPLSTSRKGRAVKLWQQTGKILGVNKTNRTKELWGKTGQLLGVQSNREAKQPTPTQNIVYNIEYAPVLSGIADTSDVKEILQQDKQSLFEQLKRIEHDRERLKFA